MAAFAKRPRVLIALILTATVLGGGGVGFAVAGGFDGDREDGERRIAPATTSTSATSPDRSPDVIIDGAIRTADARRAISAAANRVDGVALTVDRDDGRYELEMQRPDGTIAEVLIDERFVVLGIDPGD